MQRALLLAQVLYKGANAAFIHETVPLAAALVDQFDLDAGVEKTQLAQALGQYLIVKLGIRKRLSAGGKADLGPAAAALAGGLQRCLRYAVAITLVPALTLAMNDQLELFRQRVDNRHTNAMQPARNLVGVVVEFAAGMQYGH